MKNSITVKFIAVFLCAAALLGIAASGIGFLCLGATDLLSGKSFSQVTEESLGSRREYAADVIVRSWASNALGGIPQEVADNMLEDGLSYLYDTDKVFYTITDPDGTELYSNYRGQEYAESYDIQTSDVYYEKLWEAPETAAGSALTEESLAEAPDWDGDAETNTADDLRKTAAPTEAIVQIPDNVYTHEAHFSRSRIEYQYTNAYLGRSHVTLYLAEGAEELDPAWTIIRTIWLYRHSLLWILILSAAVFAVMAVYLCTAAGHAPGSEEIRAKGLNAIPLDLYAFLLLCFIAVLGAGASELGTWVLAQQIRVILVICLSAGFLSCLLFVGFCFACAAQFKTPGGFWWRNTLCMRCLRGCWKLAMFCFGLLGQLIPRLLHLAKSCILGCLAIIRWLADFVKKHLLLLWHWVLTLLGRVFRRMERFFARLPLTWQWLAGGLVMVLVLAVAFESRRALYILFAIGLSAGLVLYGAGAFGILLDAAQKMRGGDLEMQIDDKYLTGSFRDFAEELNGLAGVAIVAAQRELKSERMKTELITNVSHDIKTPLTSIINYADLLAKPHTPEEEKVYLEVLSRQSARMKKLIEDLIEMSKATTGNIPVEITQVDAVESVNQALGEFTDKLDAAGLIPVFRQPSEPITMLADGRLVWRAMSNLLSNAVKYAMPGTRLYVDVTEVENEVLISMKNISRAELNVSAEELLERFVRGDTSRNTEGSGLGLNIAQSLMELQKGQLQLLVDGDLFKATLIFPKA